jgi:antibiotic biosynthesis monooxygenase (ABM) superfamily enzyme
MTEQPKYWKHVLITIVTVYPLILVSDALISFVYPAIHDYPPYVGIFFSVVIVAALMVKPVMPLVFKYLGGWLHR